MKTPLFHTVCLLGGAGFIGKNLALKLIERGYYVQILDTLSPQIHGQVPSNLDWLSHPSISFTRGSILDRDALNTILYEADCVVNLAAETGTGQSMYEIARYTNANSLGTAVFLDVLANNHTKKVKKILLSSSRSVYGEGAYFCPKCADESKRLYPPSRNLNDLKMHLWQPTCQIHHVPLIALPTRETDPIQPASIYAATKFSQEELVRIACSSLNIDYSILRLQNVYGEGQSLVNPYTGILSIFSTRILNRLNLPLFEDGEETRDFVHIDDVVSAFIAAIECPSPIRQTINVGSGVGSTIRSVAEILLREYDSTSSLEVTADFRLGDIRHNRADIALMYSILRLKPKVPIEEGLSRFAKWVMTQPIPQDRLDNASAELRKRGLSS